MVALTSTRYKREASFPSSRSGSDYNHLHIAKKRKSSPYIAPTITSESLISRVNLYPPMLTPIFRKLRAPFRFVSGFTAKLKRLFTNSRRIISQNSVSLVDMGNVPSAKYIYAKKSSICRCKQNVAKYKKLDQKGAYVSSEVPLRKKLQHESIEKDDLSLRRLRSDIKVLETKLIEKKRDLRTAEKKEERANEPFRPLTEEEHEMVNFALSNSNQNKILVTHENSNITITGEVLQCLSPQALLNDEIINLYFELLKEREIRNPKKFLKCHFFNTFFYKKLVSGRIGYDYMSVRRWTTHMKLGYSLLECDKIFVPIHQEMHWCLAVINIKEEKFQYLDSLGGIDQNVLRVLARYITDEAYDKTGKNINVTSWKQEFVTDNPKQENGYDCGMFMIKYADFYSRGIGLCFNQEHMLYFRARTAKEILKLRAK